jgi:hypothetical protein
MLDFPNEYGPYSTMSQDEPERVLAFEEDSERRMLEDAGRSVIEFSYGYWRVLGGWRQQDVFVVS